MVGLKRLASLLAGAALLAGATLLAGTAAYAAPDEYQVKAVFLFNFSQFVEWPEVSLGAPGTPFPICVYGAERFGGQLEAAVQNESVHGHPLRVRRLAQHDAAEECRMVFIGETQTAQLDQLLQEMHEHPVLTVSDISGAAERGTMIQFTNDKQRLRLRINVGAARAAGLTISSQLLRPAEIVGPMEGEPHA